MSEDMPKSIKMFCGIYLTTAALVVVGALVKIAMLPALLNPPENIKVAVVSFAIAVAILMYFLTYLVRGKRSIGAKWAIVVFFFIVLFALPFSMVVRFDIWEVVLLLINGLAVYQLFLPDSDVWFSGHKQAAK